jgi:hypothetical protein
MPRPKQCPKNSARTSLPHPLCNPPGPKEPIRQLAKPNPGSRRYESIHKHTAHTTLATFGRQKMRSLLTQALVTTACNAADNTPLGRCTIQAAPLRTPNSRTLFTTGAQPLALCLQSDPFYAGAVSTATQPHDQDAAVEV